MTKNKLLAEIKKDPYAIVNIDNPSTSMQLAAVSIDGNVIEYIKNPSDKVAFAAVNQIVSAIQYVENPSEDLQLMAVKKSPSVIVYIDNPSLEIQLTAVKIDARVLWDIRNPHPKVKQLLVQAREGGSAALKARMSESYLAEALKPDQYRQYVKGWDKTTNIELFQDTEYETDRNKYRMYVPIESDMDDFVFPKKIVAILKDKGYKISDYAKGLARNIEKPQRQMKIGKLLKGYPDLQQIFAQDPQRQAGKNEHEMVISRHPYDLAGMSTGRGWTSCMNIDDGEFKNYVAKDVQYGTIIAYAVKKGDRNIEHPVARVLVKKFKSEDDVTKVIWGIENRVYGEEPSGFRDAIIKWTDTINDKLIDQDQIVYAKRNDILYNDSQIPPVYIKGTDISDLSPSTQIRIIIYNPKYFRHIKNPNINVTERAISENGWNIKYVDLLQYSSAKQQELWTAALKSNPKVVLLMDIDTDDENEIIKIIKINHNCIKYLPDISDDLKEWVVSLNPYAIKSIKNPSDELIMSAMKKYGGQLIEYIKNPSDEVIKFALTSSPFAIRYIKNPTEEHQFIALSLNSETIQYIKNPTTNVQIAAVTGRPTLIRYIKNPTEKIQRIAIFQDKNLIKRVISHIPTLVDNIQLEIIEKVPSLISNILYPCPEAQLLAMKKNPEVFVNIRNPTEEVKQIYDNYLLSQLEEQPAKVFNNMIDRGRIPSEKLVIAAVRDNPTLISRITKQTEAMQMAIIEENVGYIVYIKEPMESVQLKAVEENLRTFKFIDNPTEKVIQTYHKLKEASKDLTEGIETGFNNILMDELGMINEI